MTTKEKRDAVLREVIKPELKNAGYSSKKGVYVSIRDGCCMSICISNSRFSSTALGFGFGFDIFFMEGDYSRERLQIWNTDGRDSINESFLLPDCGFLHPYRKGMTYQIDGYKNYQPQDMDVDDIKIRIETDLHSCILPQLAEVNCPDDWKRKKQEWNEKSNSLRVRLLRFYDSVHRLAEDNRVIPEIFELQRWLGLSVEELREGYPVYEEIKAWSSLPNYDNWAFILAVLK